MSFMPASIVRGHRFHCRYVILQVWIAQYTEYTSAIFTTNPQVILPLISLPFKVRHIPLRT